jgi:hypothetical protein
MFPLVVGGGLSRASLLKRRALGSANFILAMAEAQNGRLPHQNLAVEASAAQGTRSQTGPTTSFGQQQEEGTGETPPCSYSHV